MNSKNFETICEILINRISIKYTWTLFFILIEIFPDIVRNGKWITWSNNEKIKK